jgi:DNA (cytosine-5)-methyltransferase 1
MTTVADLQLLLDEFEASSPRLNKPPTGGLPSPERHWVDPHGGFVVRDVERRNPGSASNGTSIGVLAPDVLPIDVREAADSLYLRANSAPVWPASQELRVADLFSGCGAMSLGVAEACRALALQFRCVGAFDISKTAMGVYAANFDLPSAEPVDLSEVLEPRLDTPETKLERSLRRTMGRVDLVIAGPPCQGHSNLNNATRRNDPRNSLYFRVARFAKLYHPRFILVENVVTVKHDKGRVVQRTLGALQAMGYQVDERLLDLSTLGVPQIRRRHLIMAVRTKGRRKVSYRVPDIRTVVERYKCSPRDLRWAIGDLVGRKPGLLMDRHTVPIERTQRRIDYLFNNDIYDLPNSERPFCHREKVHTYNAVYGRLRWDRPAPTITGGFDTMGRGRFVHPDERRTLTPREAARIQFIPDFFDFSAAGSASRRELVEMIGNAVPPKLAYVFALELLR